MPESKTLTRAQLFYVDFMADVLAYTVVLNLFVEYVDAVTIDSFTVSVLTAVVMKLLIDLIQYAADRVKSRQHGRGGVGARAGLALALWAIMFGSKIVILLVVQLIFEDDVDLGGFVDVLLLTIAMMVTRRLSHALFLRFGEEGDTMFRAVEEAGPG